MTGLDLLDDARPALGCTERIATLGLPTTDVDRSHGGWPAVDGTTPDLAWP